MRTVERTRAVTMGYGLTPDGQVSLGSLDLLIPERNEQNPLQPIARDNTRTPPLDLRPGTQDLVIMNPPFTRKTQPGLFSAGPPEPDGREIMEMRLREVLDETGSNQGNGLALPFSHLADRMVRPGGTIALLLPATALSAGPSLGRDSSSQGGKRGWTNLRRKIAQDYRDVTIITIAADHEQDTSFSDDTAIAEVILVARKGLRGEQPDTLSSTAAQRGYFVTLRERPRDERDARLLAQAIRRTREQLQGIGQGIGQETGQETGQDPTGEITLEGETRGSAIITELPLDDTWQMAGVIDQGIIQAVLDLQDGRMAAGPDLPPAILPIAALGEIAEIGPANVRKEEFMEESMEESRSWRPSHQVLQNHDCTTQNSLEIEDLVEMSVRTGMEKMEPRVRRNKSRLHLSNNCRYNSQPTTACMTREPSMGGQGWPCLHLKDRRREKALAVWMNSSLGLIAHWALSNRTKNGLGYLSQKKARCLPVLNIAELTGEQLDQLANIFDENRDRTLRPASQASQDPLRIELDRRIFQEVLELGEETLRSLQDLRERWCREPSVKAGKEQGKPGTPGAGNTSTHTPRTDGSLNGDLNREPERGPERET